MTRSRDHAITTFKIQKDCKYIPKHLTAPEPLTEVHPVPTFLKQAIATDKTQTKVFQAEQAILTKKTITLDKNISLEEVLSSTQETVTPNNNITSE